MFYDQLNALGRTELFAQNFTEDGIYFIEDLKHHQLSIILAMKTGLPTRKKNKRLFFWIESIIKHSPYFCVAIMG